MAVSIAENARRMSLAPKYYPDVVQIPDNILIEVTNACNLRCSMCYNSKMKRKKGLMSFELFQKIVGEMSELNIHNLGLYTTGEAFLHPQIFDFIKYAKKSGINYVYITTNGQLITDKKISQIIDSGLDSIKFSIDSGTKIFYEKSKAGASWDKLVDVVKKMRNARDSANSNLRIFASYIVTNETKKNLDRYHHTFDKYVDETHFTSLHNQGLLQTTKKTPAIHPCNLLWNRFIVTYDGKLTICCFDFESKMTYGDLNKDTLQNSWNNQEMVAYRTLHRTHNFKQMPMCNYCDKIKE